MMYASHPPKLLTDSVKHASLSLAKQFYSSQLLVIPAAIPNSTVHFTGFFESDVCLDVALKNSRICTNKAVEVQVWGFIFVFPLLLLSCQPCLSPRNVPVKQWRDNESSLYIRIKLAINFIQRWQIYCQWTSTIYVK